MSATINLEKKHFPVLLDEIIKIISPRYSGTFLDCTFGQGGYSEKILENANNKVIAFDRDIIAKELSIKFKNIFKDRFYFNHKKFSEIKNINKKDIKAIIFDLGYSKEQVTDKEKGLSFNHKGKLNMKMGLNSISANEIINNLGEKELTKIFRVFGEENSGKNISKKINSFRKKKNIQTEDLVNIINSVKKKKYSKIHNATKVFQALRIIVNNEISELIYGLINSFKILPIGGMIVIVTFHSIEDKIVKFFLKNYSENTKVSRYLPLKDEKKSLFKLINKKPILPSKKELKLNPASRSAKLRYGIKINHNYDFSEFINKFNYLLETESLYKKI